MTFRWFVGSVCIGIFVVVGLKSLYDSSVLRSVFDCSYAECRPGKDGAMTNLADDGSWFTVPAVHATPAEVWKVAYKTCAPQSVEALGRMLAFIPVVPAATTPPPATIATTPEGVARRYAHESGGQSMVYEGCLQGFRTGLAGRPGHDQLVLLLAIAAVFVGIFSVPRSVAPQANFVTSSQEASACDLLTIRTA
jgi:hypothetical protein